MCDFFTIVCNVWLFHFCLETHDTTTRIRDVDAKSHVEQNANEEHIMRASGWVPFSGIVYWGVHTQRGLWHVTVKLTFIKVKILYKITCDRYNILLLVLDTWVIFFDWPSVHWKKKINRSRPLKVFCHILFIASTLMLNQRELDPDKKPWII